MIMYKILVISNLSISIVFVYAVYFSKMWTALGSFEGAKGGLGLDLANLHFTRNSIYPVTSPPTQPPHLESTVFV